jgi:predicted dienelactone hydrolase
MTRALTSTSLLLLLLAAPPAWGRFERGPYRVGVTTITFTKTAVGTTTPRPLATVIWYPAAPGTGTEEALGRRDASVRRGRFPLIVYTHGACGRPTEATYLTKALASFGFVVAAVPHPGHTGDDFPGCLTNVLETFVNRVPDVSFAIDSMLALADDSTSRFAGRLRRDAVALAGISFGGNTTLRGAQLEPRLVAALALAPGGTNVLGPSDIAIPTLVIGAERDTVVTFPESERAYERVAAPRFLVELLGANHLSFVDDCFNEQLNLSFCVPGDIAQEDAHRLVLRYVVPFARRYLLGKKRAGPALARQVDGVALTADPTP